MDDALHQLQELNKLIKTQPRYQSGLGKETWSGLTQIIGSIQQTVTDTINADLNNTINQTVSQITRTVNNEVNTLGDVHADTVNSIWDDVVGGVQDLIDWLAGLIQDVKDWFNDTLQNIKDLVSNVYMWLTTAINNVSSWVVNAVNTAIQSVSDWISGVVDAVATWLTNTYNTVKEAIQNVVNNVGTWINNTVQNVRDWIAGAIQTTQNFINTLKATVEDKIQDILNWIQQAKENIVAWWNNIRQELAHFINTVILPNLDKLIVGANNVKDLFKNVWDAISSGNYQNAFDLIDGVFTTAGLPAPIEAVRAIVSTLAFFWETVHLQFVGMEYNAQKQAVIASGLEPLDLSTMTQAIYKGLVGTDEFTQNASLGGINKNRAKLAIEANRPLMSAGQIQQAFLRGEIDLETHDRMLKSYGLSDANIKLIKELYLLIPGPSDLIRMAVREAFTPEIAETFGQYDDFPPEFASWAAKQGLSEDWSKRYWAAHWDLPSATMGFEMLHRGVIDQDELTLLLRALDVMPFWREKLIQISYNPLTRVDVRRMYNLGVIDETQVKRSYLDLGYDEQKADWLTEFTVRYYTPEDQNQQDEFKTLARSTYSQAYKKHVISEDEYRQFLTNMRYYSDDVEMLISIDNFSILQAEKVFDLTSYRKDWQKLILSAYDRGLFHRNEVSPMLLDLGYSEEEAIMELDLSDYNRTLAIRNLVVNQVHDQYVSYIIDVVGLHSLLDAFNFTAEEIDRLQEEWDVERNLRTRKPSLSELKTFFKQGLITMDEFLDELRGLGYNEKYIPMYQQTV